MAGSHSPHRCQKAVQTEPVGVSERHSQQKGIGEKAGLEMKGQIIRDRNGSKGAIPDVWNGLQLDVPH